MSYDPASRGVAFAGVEETEAFQKGDLKPKKRNRKKCGAAVRTLNQVF